jgi:hypothetical protein
MEYWVNLVGGCSALIAAVLWFWASSTPIPAFPDVGLDSDSTVFEPVRRALQSAGRRNAWAAFFSGVAALALSVNSLLPSLPSGN